jgi:hypothetical protein
MFDTSKGILILNRLCSQKFGDLIIEKSKKKMKETNWIPVRATIMYSFCNCLL